MTRLKQARTALCVVAFANTALIVARWPRPPRYTEFGTIIVGGAAFLLIYREDPASFHRRVGRAEATRIILAPIIVIGVTILLIMTHLL